MARAAANALHPDDPAADDARLPFPIIDLVRELEIAGVAVRVKVPRVREGRTAGFDG